MKLKVFSKDGTARGEREFSIPEFEGNKGRRTLRQVLVALQANRRQGSASSKTRAEVRGGGRKPWRQKGTGMARAGSRRSPIWRGGGVTFGPGPRSYRQGLNRKMKHLAFLRAVYERASAGNINVIESFELEEPKTRLMAAVLDRIAPRGKLLLVDDVFSDVTILAGRNIERITLTEAMSVNAFDVSIYERVIISEKGVERILARKGAG